MGLARTQYLSRRPGKPGSLRFEPHTHMGFSQPLMTNQKRRLLAGAAGKSALEGTLRHISIVSECERVFSGVERKK